MKRQRTLYGTGKHTRKVPIINNDNDLLLAWVKRGKTRKQVLFNIIGKTMPSEIVAKLAGKERKSQSIYAQVSRALAELEALKLIECLTEQEKTGRQYQLTKKGNFLLKHLS